MLDQRGRVVFPERESHWVSEWKDSRLHGVGSFSFPIGRLRDFLHRIPPEQLIQRIDLTLDLLLMVVS